MEVWHGMFIKQNRTFDDYIANYKMEVSFFNLERDLLNFNREIEDELLGVLRQESLVLGSIKFSYDLLVELVKDTANGEEYVEGSNASDRFSPRIVKEKLRAEIDRKKVVVAGWVERGSGRYNPIKGGAYIPLPPKLQGKQAIINIKNN